MILSCSISSKSCLLPSVWNALFTILFRCISKKITGSDNTNKLFHTLLYTLYSEENIDLGQLLRVQFTQGISSSMKITDISCARFWLTVVKNARGHFKVPTMFDAQMANFDVLNTTTFASFNEIDFHHIGEIPYNA